MESDRLVREQRLRGNRLGLRFGGAHLRANLVDVPLERLEPAEDDNRQRHQQQQHDVNRHESERERDASDDFTEDAAEVAEVPPVITNATDGNVVALDLIKQHIEVMSDEEIIFLIT